MKSLNIYKLLKDYYEWEDTIDSTTVKAIDQYPHIYDIKSNNLKLIVKILNNTNSVADSFLYELYSNSNNILYPIKNRNKQFYVVDKGEIIFAYKKLEPIKYLPSARWWAETLMEFHSLSYKFKSSTSDKLWDSKKVYELFKKAQCFMDSSILCELNKLTLNEPHFETICKQDYVLLHGDPSNRNVLMDGKILKLIDCENPLFYVKEFDIQHLLWNHLLGCSSLHEWKIFCEDFLNAYENRSNKKINIKILSFLYKMDFLKTISWLYIVSNDGARGDQRRQSNELILYESILKKGYYMDSLRFLIEKIKD